MKTKNIVVSGIIGILVLGTFIYLARPTGENGTAAKTPVIPGAVALAAEKTFYDFGSISMAAGNVSQMFKVRNTGSEPIEIEKMYTSCMCTTASMMLDGKKFGPYGMPGHGFAPSMNQKMMPDEEAEVEVIFDPAAHGPSGVGRIDRTVFIENSAGGPLQLSFSAMVTP